MAFGSLIRSNTAPSTGAMGIGGDANTIWHSDMDSDQVYELNTTDFSAIRNASSPSTRPYGIGGDANTIWHCDITTCDVYELSTTDFSVIRSANAPSTQSYGIGGDANTIWHCDLDSDKIYELSTTDFSVIYNNSSPGIYPVGIGGTANRIWHENYASNIYELGTTDFSVVRSAAIPTLDSQGIGGNNNTIWTSDNALNNIYEIDADVPSTYIISGNVKDSDGNNLNNVTITLEDGTNYSTSTNVSGNYSQAVNPDVYTVIASLAGYISSSASVDASSSNQTQNFTLSKPVLSGTVSDEFNNPIRDADITISNGTTYTTTTDENGAYSQVVDADTYDIAVSKSRSTYHDITISSVAVTADTTQDITMLLDKMLGRQNAIKGISIPGGISMGRSRR